LAALVSPVQNIIFLTVNFFTLLVLIAQQPGQAGVQSRLSLSLWYYLCVDSKARQSANKFSKSQIRKFSDFGPSANVAICGFAICEPYIFFAGFAICVSSANPQIHNFPLYKYKRKLL
jgi:hypothetical protein